MFDLSKLADVYDADFDTIIDVRAPSEFAEDHVPGAINLPVLSDDERARVGTIYVQDCAFRARKVGAALVARNAAAYIEGPLADKDGGWKPLVYCWRGGQRSGSFASILSQIGWRAETVQGGYQSYRRLVVRRLYEDPMPCPVLLLDGNTGTAKTEVLNRLPAFGVQVIDLEGLANHRGSVLGGMGPQPSQKMFESLLAERIERLDPSRPVVVEAESSKVGDVLVPPSVFAAMKTALRIEITAPVAARAAFLTRSYSDLISDDQVLSEKLDSLVRIQGRERIKTWQTMVQTGDHQALAEDMIREHYDPRYHKVRDRSEAEILQRLTVDTLEDSDIDLLAETIARAITGTSV